MRKVLLAAAFFALFATGAHATDNLYISEYNSIGATGQVQVASEPALTDQVTADFTSAAVQSSAFQPTTSIVRLICNVQCSVLFGANPTATNANKVLPALTPEYFYVQPGQSYKVSVHTNP